MKKFRSLIVALALVVAFGATACSGVSEDLAGVTDTTIYVGNTAATTGASAAIGVPFNFGINAAFAAYNAKGGYKGLNEAGEKLETGLMVELKHYDDGGVAENAYSMMDTLIHQDEIFAVVGNFGAYGVNANLDLIKQSNVPMVYAAAGNDELLNESATGGERGIFPVQPLNKTEGRMLILRSFAPVTAEDGVTPLGGLGATKVGVITSTVNEASNSLTAGIKAEAENLSEDQKANIVYTETATGDFSAAAATIKAAGCDVVIITGTGAEFTNALVALANANVYCKVMTSYNNASAAVFNDPTSQVILDQYADVFKKMAIYAQGWLDITSLTYVYNADTLLLNTYKTLGLAKEEGMAGFNEAYWAVAENIFNYGLTVDPTVAFQMSYDSFALAGYIAGDLFCQGLAELEASGKALTRANFISVMETKDYKIAMADVINFKNGMRAGVQSFSLTQIFNSKDFGLSAVDTATSLTVHTMTSVEDYRELIG